MKNKHLLYIAGLGLVLAAVITLVFIVDFGSEDTSNQTTELIQEDSVPDDKTTEGDTEVEADQLQFEVIDDPTSHPEFDPNDPDYQENDYPTTGPNI